MVDNITIVDALTGLVVFVLSDKEYCADLKDISAIINPKELSGSSELKGEAPFIKINELMIPLLDLHKIFNLKRNNISEDKRILTVESDNFIFGFIVDKVKEIFTMNNDFKNKMDFIQLEKGSSLKGILNYEGRSLYMPDFNVLYRRLKNS